MNRHKYILFSIFFLILFALSAKEASSQLVLGQYEDEAPVKTWNIFGISSASSIARGDTRFALASDCSVTLTNPALLANLSKFTFTLNSSLDAASLFKYSIVNTGVINTDENMILKLYAVDFVGVSINIEGWALGLNMALLEHYDRPEIELSSPNYSLHFIQEGTLKNIHIALARKFCGKISIGIGLNIVSGNSKKNIEEKLFKSNIAITDDKSHDFQGFFLNGGLVFSLSNKFTAAAVFRSPFKKKSKSKSLLRFLSPKGETDIQIGASANNVYRLPLLVGVGFSYEFTDKLRLASDFSFFNWSKYDLTYFEEDFERNFKDIIKVGIGIEYFSPLKIFNQNLIVPYRAGVNYDPQPMIEPHSHYLYFSFGTGIQWGRFFLDIGSLIGNERGSGDNLSARRISITLGFK